MKFIQYTSIGIKNTKVSSLILLISLISTISCTSFCDYCQCYNEASTITTIHNNSKETLHVVNCDGNQLINKNDMTTAYKMQMLEWPSIETHEIIGYFNNLNLTVLPRFV